MGLKRYDEAERLVRQHHLEKIGDQEPIFLLDVHPDGRLAALLGPWNPTGNDRVAVYDLQFGRILWKPQSVSALCWLPGGHDVLLTREVYLRDPEFHNGPIRTASPFQEEYLHYLERWSWPGKQRLSGCEVAFPTGRPVYVTASLKGDLAVFQWREQDCSGIELFALTDEGVHQIDGMGYRADTNIVECPVFSPDGRYVVLVCTTPYWWGPDYDDEAFVSPGGRFQVGEVVLLDIVQMAYRSIPVYEELPAGWSPENPDLAPEHYVMDEPEFLDASRFRIRLTTGGERIFSTD